MVDPFAAGLARVRADIEYRAMIDKIRGREAFAAILEHAHRSLGQIGRRARESMNGTPMAKPCYEITLIETDGDKRLDLGVYQAADPNAAILKAQQKYRGTLRNLQTDRWRYDVREASPDRYQPNRRGQRIITESLL